MGEYWTVIN